MAASSSCAPDFIAVALVSEPLPPSHMIVHSAAKHGYDLRLLVLNHSKTNFVSTRMAATLPFLRAPLFTLLRIPAKCCYT